MNIEPCIKDFFVFWLIIASISFLPSCNSSRLTRLVTVGASDEIYEKYSDCRLDPPSKSIQFEQRERGSTLLSKKIDDHLLWKAVQPGRSILKCPKGIYYKTYEWEVQKPHHIVIVAPDSLKVGERAQANFEVYNENDQRLETGFLYFPSEEWEIKGAIKPNNKQDSMEWTGYYIKGTEVGEGEIQVTYPQGLVAKKKIRVVP